MFSPASYECFSLCQIFLSSWWNANHLIWFVNKLELIHHTLGYFSMWEANMWTSNNSSVWCWLRWAQCAGGHHNEARWSVSTGNFTKQVTLFIYLKKVTLNIGRENRGDIRWKQTGVSQAERGVCRGWELWARSPAHNLTTRPSFCPVVWISAEVRGQEGRGRVTHGDGYKSSLHLLRDAR